MVLLSLLFWGLSQKVRLELMRLNLEIKPFSFDLTKALQTSQGLLRKKQGWLIHLEQQNGNVGWGEVAPIETLELERCEHLLYKLEGRPTRNELEASLPFWPKALAFGIGSALAEIDSLIGFGTPKGWLDAPESAVLLHSNGSILEEVDLIVNKFKSKSYPLTLKWKVAVQPISTEKELLKKILDHLPRNARLRLDANCGWDRNQADQLIDFFLREPRLEWLEQPLPTDDLDGLMELSKQIPIALDESLLADTSLLKYWQGWQVRRPILEGDPRILLKELNDHIGFRMISTAFETGIGSRWVNHLAALQQKGPTPTAPGLAPGWRPKGALFSNEPKLVWASA